MRLTEQHRIVAKVEQRMAWVDVLEHGRRVQNRPAG